MWISYHFRGGQRSKLIMKVSRGLRHIWKPWPLPSHWLTHSMECQNMESFWKRWLLEKGWLTIRKCRMINGQRLPENLDMGVFTLPIHYEYMKHHQDLCDLGSAINLVCDQDYSLWSAWSWTLVAHETSFEDDWWITENLVAKSKMSF